MKKTAKARLLPSRVLAFWGRLLELLVEADILTSSEAKTASLEISSDPSLRDSPRHYAAAEDGGRGPVLIHRNALRLPPEQIIALLAHEMGHVIDKSAFNRPLARILRGESSKQPTDGEKRADYLANRFLGTKIRYDEKLVQTLGAGIARPSGLR